MTNKENKLEEIIKEEYYNDEAIPFYVSIAQALTDKFYILEKSGAEERINRLINTKLSIIYGQVDRTPYLEGQEELAQAIIKMIGESK